MKRSTLLGMFQRISRIQTHRSNLRTQWFTSDASTTRLSKLVATRAGLSRSQAEKQIRQGLVTVNGTIIDTPFSMVDTKAAIKSQGKLLLHKERPAQVWLVHKLAGELVSDVDDKNRPLIWDRLTQFRGCKAVGRLDFHTEGLLVVTNDGLYKRTLELSDLHRVYRVRVHGTANQVEAVGRWVPRGVRLRDQTWLDPMRVRVERKRQNSTNHWLQVTCTQGKNRQVRRVMEHFGCKWKLCGVHELSPMLV